MVRPSKRQRAHVEPFVQGQQPSHIPLQQRVREYGLTSGGHTTLQTAYISLSEVSLGEMNEWPSSPPPQTQTQCPAHDFFDDVIADINADVCDLQPVKRRQTAATFLDETIFLEGRGNEASCSLCRCGDSDKTYRCKDCFGLEMFCQACILQCHQCLPLHRIEEWTSGFFCCTTLKSLGMRIQLGHNPSHRCHNPRPSSGNTFVVIDVHGIHEITLDFCGCETAQIRFKQLLRARWYPVTTTEPWTAATFSVLKQYHLLSFESKVLPYKFYHSLARRTSNTGLSLIKDRYSAFMCMVREWQHLQQLRRSSRCHHPTGANETDSRELAVLCPACPHPGKNLPDRWETAPPSMRQGDALIFHCRWLYALFIAIDANFHEVDPGLNAGWAYFMEETTYKEYLSITCVSHNAVNMADTKSSRGLAATGVGTVDCARHEFKLPTGVGDLQKGEKYLNMDYLVFSALVVFTIAMLNILYDIACQWLKKLWTRMDSMPTRLHIAHNTMLIQYFIPKFHIGAHIAACQTTFSWNLTKFVGRTDGEAPEWGWANIDRMASSTKEMGPGSRRDMLDDHFGDWNWKKVTMFSWTLKHKMEDAVKWKREHCGALRELEGTIQAVLLDEWRLEIEAWEEDDTKPNPFKSRVAPITQTAVQAQLVELEAQEFRQRLKHNIANVSLHPTDKQRVTITNRTNMLQRRIDSWTRIQELYMPIVSALRLSADSNASTTEAVLKPQHCPLYFPSAIDAPLHCDQRLLEQEWELWHAQAHDALNEICSHLRLRSHMYKFKDKNLCGQAASTRAQNLIARVEAKKDAGVDKYSGCLDKVGWGETLQPLRNKDVRQMGDFMGRHTQGTGTISWIWLATDVDTSVHIEWCKACACAARWSEEVQLLVEEMRRILVFLQWQACWWSDHANLCILEKPSDQEGLQAYAYHQSALHSVMRSSFQALWSAVPQLVVSTQALTPKDAPSLTLKDTPSIDHRMTNLYAT
ncbi:uncharacterized protein F5891DRAFT_1129906 [Suillus fuscotomentosus]|uniref:CxC2-like cysteine cluster KDZ transposase-associated domain-containing protein n=1 Tax=Suillus fuscotomentosus TaxID=1912939 RepID=A0AAD4E0E7_9AGAM|nr:uncharacterized protein F5891DRAFT_1129906 [Suillus fuscotomentosus]KAG1897430.1 hypothetical protein F5891DRAFT_1129906 [Suillus fuscotomentosus]